MRVQVANATKGLKSRARDGRRKKRHRKCQLRPPQDLTKTSIEQRPAEVALRTDFGHWEEWRADTVEIIRGQLYLITLVERVSRFIACFRI